MSDKNSNHFSEFFVTMFTVLSFFAICYMIIKYLIVI